MEVMSPAFDSFFCMTKKEFQKNIPGVFKKELWDREEDYQGNISYKQIKWSDLESRNGRHGFYVVKKSNNWNDENVKDDDKMVIIQGQFSHLKGQSSKMLQKGQGKDYPKNSLLTAKEAIELTTTHSLFLDPE